MATDETSLPKYVQTAELLIREIAAGRLPDGARLKPEREMASGLGVSVGTLRKALDDLTRRGLLERVQGSGNYVKCAAEVTGIYALFRLELVEGGGLPTAQVLNVRMCDKTKDLPDFGPSNVAHRIRRLRHLSGKAAALEEIWLDGSWSEGIIERHDLSESLYLFYRERLGLWITRAEDRVGVGVVPDWTVPEFGPSAGETVGFVERLSRDQDDSLAEYSRTWFDVGIARYVARVK